MKTISENAYILYILWIAVFLFFIIFFYYRGISDPNFFRIIFNRENSCDSSLTFFNKNSRKKGNRKYEYFAMSYCYYLLGYNKNAISNLEKAIELGLKRKYVFYFMSILMQELGNREEALKYFQRGERINQKQRFMFWKRFRITEFQRWSYYILGDRSESGVLYKKFENNFFRTKSNKFLPDEYYHLGIFFKDENQIEKAKKYFKLTIENGKDSIFVDKAKQELEKLK